MKKYIFWDLADQRWILIMDKKGKCFFKKIGIIKYHWRRFVNFLRGRNKMDIEKLNDVTKKKINEDNCVLSDGELESLDTIIRYYQKNSVDDDAEGYYADKIFLKITKLNDMTKKKINEDNCVLSEEEFNIAREMFVFCCKSEIKYWENVDVIWEKITKLNNIAKKE